MAPPDHTLSKNASLIGSSLAVQLLTNMSVHTRENPRDCLGQSNLVVSLVLSLSQQQGPFVYPFSPSSSSSSLPSHHPRHLNPQAQILRHLDRQNHPHLIQLHRSQGHRDEPSSPTPSHPHI